MLKGLIDPVKEVEKLNKKKTALQGTVDKLKKAIEVKDYESKVRYSAPIDANFRFLVTEPMICTSAPYPT